MQTIVRILKTSALDDHHLTAVYELDSGEMDRLLPIEILPEPKKISRIGLVIVKDIDPGINDEINQFITQLGDDSWAKREAAQQALQKLGKAAQTQLEKASKSTDIEVASRAERLLALITKPAEPSQ